MSGKSNLIVKTLSVLKAFTDEKAEWGVNELSRHMDYPVSSLHRILKTLREEGILQIHPQSGKYTFGIELIRISSIVQSKSDIKTITKPFLEKLSETLNQSIYLALYYPDKKKLSFIHNIRSSHAVQYLLELGVFQPIHIAASGKAILSFLTNDEIEAVLDAEEIPLSDRQVIWEEVNWIRTHGYSITSSERKKHSIGIGAPIFDASNKVIGSIICAIPEHFYTQDDEEFIVQNIVQESTNISRNLGYQFPTKMTYE